MLRHSRGVLVLFSIVSIGMFAVLTLRRLVYPLELDCIEGVMMDHVVRLAHGQPIFVEPSLSFITLAYMPMFAAISSLLARVFGPHFWEPRLISLIGVTGTAILIARVVRTETRSALLGLGGVGVYLMAFAFTGACYDVARPDSLMVLLALSGMVVLRESRGIPGAIAAALLLSLAFFTKQHGVWFAIAATLHLLVNDRRRVIPFAVVAGICCVGGYLMLEHWLGPWFRFFTLEVPSRWSEFSRLRILRTVGHEMLGTLGLLCAPAVLSLGLKRRPWRGAEGIWMWAGLAAAGTALMATLDPSAYFHVLIPTVVFFSILGPISLHRLTLISADPDHHAAALRAEAIAGLVLSLQFVPLVYSTHDLLPHPRAVEANRTLLDDIRREPGQVLVPYHGFYTWSAGKGTSMHIIPLDDIARAHHNRLIEHDPHYLDRLFAPLRSGSNRPVIVTDVPLAQSGPLWAPLERSYALAGDLGWISVPLRPVSGNRFAPTLRYVPVAARSAHERLRSAEAAPDSHVSVVTSGAVRDSLRLLHSVREATP